MKNPPYDRPNPAEHRDIARGSGPAAILLFLQIAVVGYLGSVIYYLLKGNVAVFWTLVPFDAAILYYFPAAFALLTAIPTDSLTRTVARIAQVTGLLALLVYGGGLVSQALSRPDTGYVPGFITACAIVAGITGALLVRVLFRLGIGGPGEKLEKTELEKSFPE